MNWKQYVIESIENALTKEEIADLVEDGAMIMLPLEARDELGDDTDICGIPIVYDPYFDEMPEKGDMVH